MTLQALAVIAGIGSITGGLGILVGMIGCSFTNGGSRARVAWVWVFVAGGAMLGMFGVGLLLVAAIIKVVA